MRCLLCGNPLSVLQKLSESEFCSTDHRNSFVEDQQKCIRARLLESAARLQAARKRAAEGSKPVVHEPDPPEGPFRFALLAGLDSLGELRWIGALPAMDFPAAFPVHEPAILSGAAQTSLFPDLPWPRYNPGLWYCDYLEVEPDGTYEVLSRLARSWKPIRLAFGRAAMLTLRRPDVKVAPRAIQRSLQIQSIGGDGPVAVWDSLRFESSAADSARLLLRLEKLYALRPRAAAPAARKSGLMVEPLAIEPASRRDVRLPDGPLVAQELRFIDRVYRMRPRAGLLPSGVPSMVSIPAAAAPLGLGIADARLVSLCDSGASDCAPAAGAVMCSPGVVDFARASGYADLQKIPTEHAALHPAPETPSFEAASARLELSSARRFVRLPVRAARGSGSEGIELTLSAMPLSSPPSKPAIGPGECAPELVRRFFRPRPRGPVSAGEAGWAQIPAAPMDRVATAVVGSRGNRSLRLEAELTPAVVDRLFRPRPKTAVADSSMAEFTQASAAVEPLASKPRLPGASVAEVVLAPNPLDRLFRPRPKTAVADASMAAFTQSSAAVEPLASKPCIPGASVADVVLAPNPLDRLFRPRPKTPVADASMAAFTQSSAAVEPLVSKPCIPGASAAEVVLAPNPLDRLFRPRPKTAVADASMAAFTQASAAVEPLVSKPCIPGASVAYVVLAPNPLDRLFRPRPKSGVADASMAAFTQSSAAVEPLVSKPCIPGASVADVVLAPNPLDRLFRPRPKTAVADASMAAFTQSSAAVEPLVSKPCIPGASVAEVVLAPNPLEKLFRPRPKTAVADASMAAFTQASAAVEPLVSKPCIPGASVAYVVLAPNPLEKLFRPRPRAGVLDESLRLFTTAAITPELITSKPCQPGAPMQESVLAPKRIDRLFRPRPRSAVPDIGQPAFTNTSAASEPLLSPPCKPGGPVADDVPAVRPCTKLFRARLSSGAAGVLNPESIEARPETSPAGPVAATQALPEPLPRGIARLFRLRQRAAADSATAVEVIHAEDAPMTAAPRKATFGPAAIGEACPHFLNRLFRMRPRSPLEDMDTTIQQIRCKHVLLSDPEPVLATMPPDAIAAGPALVDRLYRMRPRFGRDCENKSRGITPAPIPSTRADRRTPHSPLSGPQEFALTLMLPVQAVDFS